MNKFSLKGLREEEFATYTHLLSVKKATVLQLAKISQLKRATLYRLLDDLVEKGLASEIYEDRRHYYIAEEPKQLIKLVKDQEEQIKALLPALTLLEAQGAERPKIKFYEGREGIKSLYDALLEEHQPLYGITDPAALFVATDYHPTFLKRRIKLKVPAYLIMPDSRLSRQRQKTGKRELREVRLVKKLPLEATFFVSGKKLAIFSMKSWFTGVLIENKEIAKSFQGIFEAFWDVT